MKIKPRVIHVEGLSWACVWTEGNEVNVRFRETWQQAMDVARKHPPVVHS